MKLPAIVPEPTAIAREALILVGGAILAALIVGRVVPALRDWIKRQWDGAPSPLGPY